MNCIACGTQATRVTKSMDDGLTVKRMRVCPCGARWITNEISDKRTLKTTNGQIGPPMASNRPPLAIRANGGLGGVCSEDPGSDPNPIVVVTPERAHARTKTRAKVTYPGEFLILWEQTGKRGGKFAALKAWERMERPSWLAVQATWRAYLLSERPRAGFVKDLSSWLNQRCHEQDWQPVAEPSNGARPGEPPWLSAQRSEAERKKREKKESDERCREALKDLVIP